MTRGIVPKLMLTELGSNLCISLRLPRVTSISTAFKYYFLHLWLQIEVVTNVLSTYLSDRGMSNRGFSRAEILKAWLTWSFQSNFMYAPVL